MQKKFFILLEEFSIKPTAEIGELSKSISKLVVAGIPVPKAVCVPQSTLRLMAQTNNLKIQVHKLIQETDLNSSISKNKSVTKIKQLIIRQKINKDLAQEFLKLYHKKLQHSYVSIQNSTPISHEDILIQNIKGDANIIESLLEIWADTVEQSFTKYSSRIHNTDKILFPSPILIQQQIDAEISGQALTFDQTDGSKKRFTIKGVWGVVNHNLDNADEYIVDSRTFNLVNKVSRVQETQFIRNLEYLKKIDLGAAKKNRDTLTTKQVEKLARIVSVISRLSLEQLEIDWGLQNNIFFIHGIKETAHRNYNKDKSEKNTILNRTKKTIKKIYVSVTRDQSSEVIKKYADGLAIMNSGRLLSILNHHPMHVVKSAQKKHLVEAISKTIAKYSNTKHPSLKNNLHLIYRSQNLTSKQLSKLKNSRQHEAREENPHLGLRGAAKILGQPQMFELELEIIKKLLEKTSNHISLLIPFVRSTDEASRVIKQVEKSGLNKKSNFDIWLELSTPENILNLANYPLNKIAGVVYNTMNIHGLLHGIDPNNKDIFSRYPINISLMKKLVKSINSTLQKQKILIDFTSFKPTVVKEILVENIEGIIVNPEVTAIAKKCIINTEDKIWQ